jgi:hypothetical protein
MMIFQCMQEKMRDDNYRARTCEEMYDEQWDEICGAMAVIAEELGLSSSEPYDIKEDA